MNKREYFQTGRGMPRLVFLSDAGAMLGGSIAGAAISGLGSILGFGSNKSANETNLRIAQMNNEFNERMMERQMEYNTAQVKQQQKYNSAPEQRKRLEEAGLNPYLMMKGGSAGTSSLANGITPPKASEAGVQRPYDPSSGFSEAGRNIAALGQIPSVTAQIENAKATAEKTRQEGTQVRIDNETRRIKNIRELLYMKEQTDSTAAKRMIDEVLRKQTELNYDIDMSTRQYTEDMRKWQSIGERYQAILASVNTLIAQKQYSWIDERMAADIALTLANADKSSAEAKNAISSQLLNDAKRRGVEISNDVAERTADAIVKEAWYSQNKAGHEARDASNRADLSGYEKVARPIREGVETVGNVLDIAGKIKDISTPDLVNELKRRGVTGISFKH